MIPKRYYYFFFVVVPIMFVLIGNPIVEPGALMLPTLGAAAAGLLLAFVLDRGLGGSDPQAAHYLLHTTLMAAIVGAVAGMIALLTFSVLDLPVSAALALRVALLAAALTYALLFLVDALIRLKQPQAALRVVNILLALPLRRVALHLQRGNLYQKHFYQIEAALADYETALRYARQPRMIAIARSWQTNALIDLLRKEAALASAEALLATGMHRDVGYQNRAYLRFWLGDLAGAAEDIATGLEHSQTPGAAAILYGTRGLLYIQQGDCETAQSDFKLALKDLGESAFFALRAMIYYYSAAAYYTAGAYDEAQIAIDKALKLDQPIYARAFVALNRAAQGDMAAAQGAWRALIAEDPHWGDAAWVRERNYFWAPALADATTRLIATL